jgi:hypothetical protein
MLQSNFLPIAAAGAGYIKHRHPKKVQRMGESSRRNLDFRGIHKHTAITAVIRN